MRKSYRIVVAVIVALLVVTSIAAYSTDLNGRSSYELINWARQVVSDAATSTVSDFVFRHKTSGTAASGFGTRAQLQAETASGTWEHIGGYKCSWSTATGGAAVSTCCLQTANASAAVDALCFAGNGAPTFAMPTAFDGLLSSTQVNVSYTHTHTLYTVPTGKSMIPLEIKLRGASGTFDQATDPVLSMGCNSTNYNNNVASATYTTPSSTTAHVSSTIMAGASVCTTGQTFRVNVTTGSTSSTTAYVDLFGYLY